jgi:hypothetical protein
LWSERAAGFDKGSVAAGPRVVNKYLLARLAVGLSWSIGDGHRPAIWKVIPQLFGGLLDELVLTELQITRIIRHYLLI